MKERFDLSLELTHSLFLVAELVAVKGKPFSTWVLGRAAYDVQLRALRGDYDPAAVDLVAEVKRALNEALAMEG